MHNSTESTSSNSSSDNGSESWLEKACESTRCARMGRFRLRLLDAARQPLPGIAMQVRLKRHTFLFGTCIGGDPFSTQPRELRYREFIREHFNALVDENRMKWYSIEKERDVYSFEGADANLAWARENGLTMRGHCLFWAKEKFVQGWVKELSPEALRAQIEDYLAATMKHFKGQLCCWDVNNEMLDGDYFERRLGPEINAWFFKRANELEPGIPLFVNEYGILDSDEKTGRYIELIERLLAQGAPIGGIGIQEHAADRFVNDGAAWAQEDRPERKGWNPLIPEQVWARLDRLSQFKLPIHLTEISSKTPDPYKRAASLEKLYRVGFAHPQVEALLLWGFWSKRHWLGPEAALVGDDFELLPAGKGVVKLLKEEWQTALTATTDADGAISFDGYYGAYEVQLPPTGRIYTATFSKSCREVELFRT